MFINMSNQITSPSGASPVRDARGRPCVYVDPARSPTLAGKWLAYRAVGDGWEYAGMFNSENDARRAVGLPPGCCP
jgi:hypothetical protein